MKGAKVLILLTIVVLLFTLASCTLIVDHTVTFDVDGEKYYEIATKGEEEVSLPQDPTKDGFVFDGWYWDKDTWLRPFTVGSLLDEKLTSNMTVYAHWIAEDIKNKSFDVKFNSMGGSDVVGQSIKYENLVIAPIEPTKEGFLFAGWFSDPAYSNRWDFKTDLVTGETTLYAKWVEDIPENRKYTIAFNSNGGSDINAYTDLAYNSLITSPSKPTKEGYVFVGWFFDNTYAKEWNWTLDRVTSNMTLYAKWVSESDATGCDIINATGFDMEGRILKTKVPNAQNKFVLSEALTMSPYSTWYVSNDSEGKDMIPSATVNLKEGDNVFYVNIISGTGTNKRQYEVNIRRRLLYSVTFYITPSSEEQGIFEEDSLIVIEEVEREGYSLIEWQYDGATWNLDTDIITQEIGNMTLEAQWKANEYTIEFDSNGGSEVENIIVVYDEEYTFSVPSKSGYNFGGWKLEDGSVLTNEKGESISVWKIPANTKVYAFWNVNSYQITYNNVDGASHNNRNSYTVEDENFELSSASKTGYSFDGWYDSDTFVNAVTSIDTSTACDIVLYAKWSTVSYNATFVAEGITVDTVEFTIESLEIVEPSIPTKIGYASEWEAYSIIADDIMIRAIYTPIVYSIVYKNVSGEYDVDKPINNNPTSYTIESSTITLNNASKEGYTFDGWYIGEEKITSILNQSYGNKEITAKWTPIVYNISLVWDDMIGGYKDGESNPSSYTVEDEITFKILENKTPGYISLGWYTAKNEGDGKKVDGIAKKSIGDIVLYAHWGLEEYSIRYHNIDGVTNTNATTYTVESADIIIESVAKIGYTFDGWYLDNALTESASTTIAKGSSGDKDYYAKWTPIIYKITYTLYGGTYSGDANPTEYTIEDRISLKSPQLSGYVFDGWFTEADGGDKVTVIAVGSIGNINLYARWLHISTITFDSNGGSAVSSIVKATGSSVSRPTQPTKDYYDFVDWYSDSALTTVFEFGAMPDEDITVYAKWTPKKYSITYVLNDGINDSANPVEYTVESDTIILESASKKGHTFIAWFDSDDFTGAVVEISQGSHGNITLFANYRINKYTISFQSNGGTTIEPITQNYATAVTEPSFPAKNGYDFVGWYSDISLNTRYNFTTMSDSDIILYAKWELAEYDIVYHLDSGLNDERNPSTYTINSDTINLSSPSKDGYDFVGWYIDSDYSQTIERIECGSYGDIEVFAKWEAIIYTITYIIPENTNNDNISTFTIETDITSLIDPSLKGYSFNGWFSDSSYDTNIYHVAGGNIGNLIVYGKFTANTYNVWMDGNEEASYDVSFDLNGAEGTIETQTINEQNTLVYPNKPIREGYLFGGWYDNSDCIGKLFDFTAQVKKDTILYANWISLEDATAIGINETKSVNIVGQNEVVLAFVPAVSGNVTITASGSLDTYGKLYNDLGVLIAQDDDNAADGLNFLIVYNVTAGRVYKLVVRGFGSSISGQIQLSIRGNASVADGGYVLTATKSSATFDSNFTLNIPEARDGYKFLGYADDNDVMYTDQSGVSIRAWDKDSDTVLYSVWERTVYTVTFVTNGGSDIDTATLAFGDRLDLNDYVTTRSGYSFAGWFLNASDTDSYNASTMPDYNLTLYAKWKTFALGSIKYDIDKKAISVNDTISAELFDAVCLDTNGEFAQFTATVNGTQNAGNSITIRLVAKSGSKSKQITISDVKVYGMPTLTVSNGDLDYINLKDGLVASWFGASGKDTYDASTTIKVRIDGDYTAGDIVTVYIDSIDIAGNVITQSIENVKLYGLPVISFDNEKTAISINDTLDSSLFSASAVDSFDEEVSVSVSVLSGTIMPGNTATIRLTATDIKGNVTNQDIVVKVYGTPIISVASKLEFKEDASDIISVDTLGITSTDTFGNELDITLSIESGEKSGGSTMIYVASVTDIAGNNATRSYSVKIYGAPEITYSCDGLKDTDSGADVLNQLAKDSFGNLLDVIISLKSGEMVGGTTVVYSLSATDHLGNTTTIDTAPIGVYSVLDIELDLMSGASDLVKVNSKGEEFFANATDSFGNACDISLEPANGYTFKAGNTIDLYVVATDRAGNKKYSEKISMIKVYGMPEITFAHDDSYILSNEDVSFLFSSKDSFGEELVLDIVEIENSDARLTITITATDDAGNVNSKNYTLLKVSSNQSYLSLYIGNTKVGASVVTIGENYTLPNEFDHYNFSSWKLNNSNITDSQGDSLSAWNGDAGKVYKVYASVSPIEYTVTYMLDGGVNGNNPSKYTVLTVGDGLPLAPAEKIIDSTTIVGGVYREDITSYVFLGWYLDSDYTISVSELRIDFGNVTLYAKWGDITTITKEGTVYTKAGNTIYFGSYPQSEVSDSALISTLNGLAGTLPTSSNSRLWTSYGYYINGSVSNYMWYIDIENDGEKYRGVYFTSYRPYFTTYSSSSSNGYQSTNGYFTYEAYWFKYEPIKWQILEEKNGKAFLFCDIAIDSQNYYINSNSHTVNGNTVYANNYAYSTIRSWLNDNFYNTAFSDLQKELVQTTLVDNSVSSTGYSSNSYACADTNDKVFLMSYKEVTSYGLTSSSRQRKSTDYAKSQGCWASTSSGYVGNCWWWLRSPYNFSSRYARGIYLDGDVSDYYDVGSTYYGVVPALWIAL